MKTWSIIVKSLKEQFRNIWVLLLTISMAPFFIFVYYLMLEASKPHYDVLVLNKDTGVSVGQESINLGELFIEFANGAIKELDTINIPLSFIDEKDRSHAIRKLQNKKGDALIVIPEDFSKKLLISRDSNQFKSINIELVGNLTDIYYLTSAVFAGEFMNEYIYQLTNRPRTIVVKETSLGRSQSVDDFELIVPGLLILSLIMLMFTATIAFVSEVENKTIIRLKLSKLKTIEYMIGTSVIQLLIGFISIILTLAVAVALGFDHVGSLWAILFIATLTSISIIAFSLILAAVTKTVNEVLIVGNFPLFLFMFFTGAAFPFESKGLFYIAGYPISIQGLMSPTHAVTALRKMLILDMKMSEIIPELSALIIITIIYFIIGLLAFHRRHMMVK
jgi:ABC-2 type transport system permease protein